MRAEAVIEPGVTADAEKLAHFARRTFIEAYGANNVPTHVAEYVDAAFDPGKIQAALARNDTIHLLARDPQSGSLLGYTELQMNAPVDCVADPHPSQIERIYVDRSAQNQRLGGRLLDATLDVAAARGALLVWLAVWEENRAAQRFYERHGFYVAGRTHFELGPERQEDLVLVRPAKRPATPT